MACLSTSGRQGLFVAVGSRRYHNHKYLCQFVLQPQLQHQQQQNNNTHTSSSAVISNISRRSFTSGNNRNKTGIVATTTAASRLLSCNAAKTSASLSTAPTSSSSSSLVLSFQPHTKRFYHGIKDATNASVFNLMVSFIFTRIFKDGRFYFVRYHHNILSKVSLNC